MSTPVTERVDNWTERPFSGGYRELQNLADSEFSGAVRAGGAELYMTKGTVVGIHRGSIDDFEDASGTVYDAPTDALPLLAVMQERSDEVRAKYYSEETSISEVDRTLEDGKFTGYVELSENVLSGDYYLVYHQGRSMSVAYVGNAEQLLTDDEAFQRADDEVGIFEVRPVDIEPVEIPEPPEPEPDDSDPMVAGAPDGDPDAADTESAETVIEAATATEADDESTQSTDEPVTPVDDEPPTPVDDESAVSPESAVTEQTATADTEPSEAVVDTEEDTQTPSPDVNDPEPALDQSGADADHGPATPEPERDGSSETGVEESSVEWTEQAETGDSETGQHVDSRGQTAEVSGATDTPTLSEADDTTPEQTVPQSTPEQTGSTGSGSGHDGTEPAAPTEPQQDVPPTPTTERPDDGESAVGAPRSLETRAIPSLDPERTSTRSGASEPRRDAPGRERDAETNGAAQTAEPVESTPQKDQSTSTAEESSESEEQSVARQDRSRVPSQDSTTTEKPATVEPDQPEQETQGEETDTDESVSERIEELQNLLTERETEIKRLKSDLETAETERESVRQELEQVRAERDELENQVEKLERDLQQLEEELGAATNAQQRMTPQEALTGTDIFVRYRSKGDATLEKAHDSGAVKTDVTENLRLEKHTQFDADVSAVGGREYDEFLEDTIAYKFVRWVVEDLLFEIQSTGHTETLGDLYDALPKINRVELNGAVTVTVSEGGQETESTETFDVVFRERMGDPLLVANINNSRQGASESMMEGLITAAERVGQTSDQFASAFLVTESFFEPEALETVAEATRGGILSRDKRKSFVNLSRKRGYHLCLVEARNQNFHLEVPEL
ncbi:DUF7527 domain-containing protein [Salinibaculum salinum]|uniref:DUF7527 domain-containing protein n=1 Tax=Salinibaculum salinum TaxID=3131996 RepID=UPI0030EC38B2